MSRIKIYPRAFSALDLHSADMQPFIWLRPNLSFGRFGSLPGGALVEKAFYARGAQTRLEEALADTPVVRVHGPRQCGKTTLASASRQGLCCTMAKAPWDLGTAFLPFQFVHCGRRHEGATKKRKYNAQFKVVFDTIR